MSREVFFILDRSFAGDLWSLSREAHVWLIESTHNEAAARAVWERETEDYSPLHGVTTFDSSDDLSDIFYACLSELDLHHNMYAAPGPWDTIHVIGLPLNRARPDRIAEELDVEAVLLEAEAGGFAIKRASY